MIEDNQNLTIQKNDLKKQIRELRLANVALAEENARLKESAQPSIHIPVNNHLQQSQGQANIPHDIDENYQASVSSSPSRSATDQWRNFGGAGRSKVPWNGDGLSQSILLNIDLQRIDEALPPCDPDTMKRFSKLTSGQRFCANFCLLGECPTANCTFRHDNKLTSEELLCLRHSLRRVPCTAGTRCRRRDCYYGHVCLNYPKCQYKNACHWRKTHGMNLTVVYIE